MPVVRDINVERVSSRKSKRALPSRLRERADHGCAPDDCQFRMWRGERAENVKGLTLDRVTVNGKTV
jgi:hypothetical protein